MSWTLCVDFGTAYSKAAAAPRDAWARFDPARVRPLMLNMQGQGSAFLLDSAVFVDDTRVLFGRAALERVGADPALRPVQMRNDGRTVAMPLENAVLQDEADAQPGERLPQWQIGSHPLQLAPDHRIGRQQRHPMPLLGERPKKGRVRFRSDAAAGEEEQRGVCAWRPRREDQASSVVFDGHRPIAALTPAAHDPAVHPHGCAGVAVSVEQPRHHRGVEVPVAPAPAHRRGVECRQERDPWPDLVIDRIEIVRHQPRITVLHRHAHGVGRAEVLLRRRAGARRAAARRPAGALPRPDAADRAVVDEERAAPGDEVGP